MKSDIGILITNIGSPDAPTPKSVRAYLKKFLTDKRVVELPRIIWYPILYGFILPFRSKSSAKLYQKIWTEQGSPLTQNSLQLAEKLQQELQVPVALGTHYGNPSISDALKKLSQVKKIIVLPLYPQYSATSTASSFDHVAAALKSQCHLPEIQFINDYADHPAYIDALCNAIQTAWQKTGRSQHLLFSFHGIPQRYARHGDPYPERCELTARLVTEKLKLSRHEWSISYQSRLGRAAWLTPYTDKILKQLPQQGIHHIHIICPGFAVDCLETLEEIAIRGKEQFLNANGKSYHYIPALNNSYHYLHAMISHCLSNTRRL